MSLLKTILRNSKTTLAGVAAVSGGLLAIANDPTILLDPVQGPAVVASIAAGVGLIFGKDGNVTDDTKDNAA